ncbi:expressed unknown protein [Seminavis robusta]|uniref:Uncharacterized protein n=1 Tax=Seminavis robusta TaxID=568900 RepID=A0A9N8ERK0_9STRA|nr:expressed unknown protein [Seminavis robusta]|eukprot:Sro1890_g303720.1 n/a (188) ;mRNA; f:13766-14329
MILYYGATTLSFMLKGVYNTCKRTIENRKARKQGNIVEEVEPVPVPVPVPVVIGSSKKELPEEIEAQDIFARVSVKPGKKNRDKALAQHLSSALQAQLSSAHGPLATRVDTAKVILEVKITAASTGSKKEMAATLELEFSIYKPTQNGRIEYKSGYGSYVDLREGSGKDSLIVILPEMAHKLLQQVL